jgi:hypothetical protein
MSEETSRNAAQLSSFEHVAVSVVELFVAVYITLEDGTVVQTFINRSTGKVESNG